MGNKRIPVSSLKAGMVIGENIHLPKTMLKDGKAVGKDEKAVETFDALLQAGVVLSDKLVELIKLHIEYVVVDERSIKVTFDETVITEEVTKNVTVTGRLRIAAKILPNMKIKASNKIVIETNVPEGCAIESETAEIVIRGDVVGTASNPVKIKSPKSVGAGSLLFADLTSGSTVRVTKDVKDSQIIAGDEISVSGSVIRSTLNTQAGIKLNNCGSPTEKGLVTLIIKTATYENLCSTFSSKAGMTPDLMKNIKTASDYVIRIKEQAKEALTPKPGLRIPGDKKKQIMDLIETSEQKYTDAKEKYSAHQASLTDIGLQLTNQLLKNKIIISGTLFPPASIAIENTAMNFTKLEQHITFYVHEVDKKLKFKTSSAHY